VGICLFRGGEKIIGKRTNCMLSVRTNEAAKIKDWAQHCGLLGCLEESVTRQGVILYVCATEVDTLE
jgi:hypothetical protein